MMIEGNKKTVKGSFLWMNNQIPPAKPKAWGSPLKGGNPLYKYSSFPSMS
jgi:hypothetical protein